MNISPKLLLTFALGLSAATTSSFAALFTYSYTFGDGVVASGSLTGDVNGQFVDNVANVTLFVDGNQVAGPIFTSQYTGAPAFDYAAGTVVSFDVFQSNFMFATSNFAGGDFTALSNLDSFFGITTAAVNGFEAATLASSLDPFVFSNDAPTEQSRWVLTQVNTSIPDGGTTAALLGLATIGFALLHRRR